MTFVPAHEAHAIDKVSAAIILASPVSADEWLPVILKAADFARQRDVLAGITGPAFAGTSPPPPHGGLFLASPTATASERMSC
jgi:hypothetical protein